MVEDWLRDCDVPPQESKSSRTEPSCLISPLPPGTRDVALNCRLKSRIGGAVCKSVSKTNAGVWLCCWKILLQVEHIADLQKMASWVILRYPGYHLLDTYDWAQGTNMNIRASTTVLNRNVPSILCTATLLTCAWICIDTLITEHLTCRDLNKPLCVTRLMFLLNRYKNCDRCFTLMI